jgi:signal transduction histidine kinase
MDEKRRGTGRAHVSDAKLDPSLLEAIVETLDVALFERSGERGWRSVTAVPAWLATLCASDESGVYALEEAFPFLEAFLFDADDFWALGTEGSIKSGPWIETPSGDEQVYLEATAATVRGRALLLVEHPKVGYEEHVAIVQTGRETSLEHDRLVREAQRKEVLLHCIVHDLKSPLSGIVGALSMLAKKCPPDQREMLAIGLRSANRLELLIQGILAAFKAEIEALESFEFDPASAPNAIACATESAVSLAPAFRVASVQLELDPEIDPTGDWRVVAERVRLDRVVANLLGNALRYAPRGTSVRLGLARDAETITFSVEDAGPGVPEELQPNLFKKFAQGGSNAGSAGLGLYFCRISVEKWGGEIGYTPRPGGGSRVWFALRRPEAALSRASG